MTDKIIFWTPGSNNIGQVIKYRPLGSTTWLEYNNLSPTLNNYVISGTDNELYECKIVSQCANNTVTESAIIKTFLSSGLSWSFQTLNQDSIQVNWNFPSIVNCNNIKIAIYQGSTLLQAQNFTITSTGQYIFTGLTPSTIYNIVYGLTFDEQTFPENPYTVGTLHYLTPTESLTEYKRLFTIMTF